MKTVSRIAYLFSRYPLRSQTFTDNEMLGLEAHGWDLVLGSIYPPPESFRQQNLEVLKAPVFYGPTREMVRYAETVIRKEGRFPEEMAKRHNANYGVSFQSAARASNACYFAKQFERLGVSHVHVPFANRALHTALFLKKITGMTLSFTTHGQDFMVDLGSMDLLNEMCEASEFIVAVCDYSRDLLRKMCPRYADKVVRIYNGLNPVQFTQHPPNVCTKPLRILSVGRLIEFKGFHHLIDAVAMVKQSDTPVELHIVGEGEWQERLEKQIKDLDLCDNVFLRGSLSSAEIHRELGYCHLFALGCVIDSKGASDLLPTVITEAMLGGRAVLSTTVAGVPEMVVPEETGLLVEPKNPEMLVQAILRLDKDRALLNRMGEQGRLRAEKLFSQQVTIPQLASRLAKCTSQKTIHSYRWIAFYDLSLPNRQQYVETEAGFIRQSEGLPLLNGNATIPADFDSFIGVPDGMVLEMEWRSNHVWRYKLEALRTELSTETDGEVFLKAARRAVWLCRHLQREHSDPQQCLLYGAGTFESVCVWIAHQLLKMPYAIVTDEVWNGNFLRRMAKGAVAVSNTTDRMETVPDALLRADKKVDSSKREQAFREWMASALHYAG